MPILTIKRFILLIMLNDDSSTEAWGQKVETFLTDSCTFSTAKFKKTEIQLCLAHSTLAMFSELESENSLPVDAFSTKNYIFGRKENFQTS